MPALGRLWDAISSATTPVSRPVRVERLVAYTPQEIFDLVQDVEAYPKFLPHCQSIEVHARRANAMQVSMRVGVAGMGVTLTTENTWIDGQLIKLTLDAKQPYSPFQNFEGIWSFKLHETGHCFVSFEANFQVTHALAATMIDKLLSTVSEEMIGAFEARAKDVYGARNSDLPCIGVE